MNKNAIRGMIGMAVLLVLYFLAAFLIPFVHAAVFWMSFVFTLIAFGVAAFSLYTAFLQKPDARSRFYGFPIAKIGVIYGGAQLVLGLLLMALGKWVPVWVAVLLYAVLLGAAVIGLVSADAVVEEIHVQDKKLKKNVAFMRALQSQVNQMASQCSLPEMKQFSEDVRYSDPVSSDALADIERDLSAAVEDLQSAIVDGDNGAALQLVKKADNLLKERNRLCKLNKG